ncbi:MAG: GNAT family N-acetyltransferase [Peptococcaceae bacterium]|nr:GNAT family N-acetyltransferase [Peptococcaceae bacterium]
MKKYLYAQELPEQWDEGLGGNPYLSRSFLSFIESVDDSEKAYYLFEESDGTLDTRFMMHKRRDYNLTMFSRIKTRVEMNFIYVPLSVSRPGIIPGEAAKKEVAEFLHSVKGYKILLNVQASYTLRGFTRGFTCPRCVLDLRWNSFDDYISALRSSYRHRYKKALNKSSGLSLYFLNDNKMFDEQLYTLYLEVYDHSPYKLEKLSLDFFRGAMFKIFVLADGAGPVGFVQLLPNGSELIFEFVGFSHEKNREYDIYIRLLLEIIRYGIEEGYQTIDFGQTADEAKLKLGCHYETLYALLSHSNPLINAVLKMTARYIQYKPLDEGKFHVFRGETA